MHLSAVARFAVIQVYALFYFVFLCGCILSLFPDRPEVSCGFHCVVELMGLGSDTSAMDSGQKRLHELGYKQELKRDLSYVDPFLSLSSPVDLTFGFFSTDGEVFILRDEGFL